MLPDNRPPGMSPVFAGFYQYTLDLEFDETPEYDYWIGAFTQFANTI